MKNVFCKKNLWEVSRKLAKVATGEIPADLVFVNCNLVDVCTREILPNVDVAVSEGRIAAIGDCKYAIGQSTKVIDVDGKYLAPSFLDGHIHIESSMITACEYAKAVMPHGTSGIFYDPHEICNVLGVDGVKNMVEDCRKTPLKCMLTMPSCVPAVEGFEDTGAKITAKEVAEVMAWDECVGLGEMMNFPGILSGADGPHDIVGETLRAGKTATGHYSVPETGKGLNAYVASGVKCCHESTREEDALAKMRLGMYAMFREGSAWHDLKEVAKAVTCHKVDTRYACLVSDDNHPDTLLEQGHLDHLVKRAQEEGIDFETAIQMVTLNVAQCFHLDDEIGSITPGKCADMVIISDTKKCVIDMTVIDGEIIAENGKLCVKIDNYEYPDSAKNTVKHDKLSPNDFIIKTDAKKVNAHVIEIIPARVGTYDRVVEFEAENGALKANPEQDIMKAAVIERHGINGSIGLGFVKGFNIKCGALAQTVAHDAHNLLVLGTNDEDMAVAANALIDCGGGLVAVKDGKILSIVPLEIAGLMSTAPIEETAKRVKEIGKTWEQMGCKHVSPFMTMGLIALACLPEVRLTNRGLVDCRTFNFIPLVESVVE